MYRLESISFENPPAVLPIQIAYYAGLRIGKVCGLTYQDINLEQQYLTEKRSVRYDGAKHKTVIGPTKRKKVRTVDLGECLSHPASLYAACYLNENFYILHAASHRQPAAFHSFLQFYP